MSLQPCGTSAAYQRHLYHGEAPCGECRAANTGRQSKYIATPLARRKEQARSRALFRLKAMHPGQYRALYTEEMGR